ncbi:MAG: hypothetical protein HY823_14085 [Acidobacteria bacterium]|nr:hypothetical protein [Acidobacteriota bacterium]
MRTYYAGMDLDAPCGRCKLETRHRVLTLTNGQPDNLICTQCQSVHKFRPERPAAPPRVRAERAEAPPKPRSPASPSRFQELMIQEQAGAQARPYSPATRWEEGAWMDHASFGLGRVQKRLGRKVDVLFRGGLKTLVRA